MTPTATIASNQLIPNASNPAFASGSPAQEGHGSPVVGDLSRVTQCAINRITIPVIQDTPTPIDTHFRVRSHLPLNARSCACGAHSVVTTRH